ncbi:MAG: methyltransferase [Microscillaceae bacterium]|jgi:tRNA1Val (adenine37-N6)-methyltransferase|nr:methyltransferase [Microscillaceae bacterium]
MPNSYFQFKQFTIQQADCAMKVCTDSCILGAYPQMADYQRVLDIGTGTGLLALMLAQRSTATLDAVEIDALAAQQARENVKNSPFASQITVFQQAIQDFVAQYPQARYDMIIANPPFFKNNWKTEDIAKNQALHSESLNFDDLLAAVAQLLTSKGSFWVLLPEYEAQILAQKALVFGLRAAHRLLIYNRPETKIFRVIQSFGFESQAIDNQMVSQTLVIKNNKNEYTSEFKDLLKHYYLIF